MNKLNSIEQECRDIFEEIMDLMAPGKRLRYHDHMELLGRIKAAYYHLENKEYGCVTGRHSGRCHCLEEK